MTIDLDKYIAKDIVRILLEKDKYNFKAFSGYTPGNLETIPHEVKDYIIQVAWQSYIRGAKRVCQQVNRKEDDKVRKAQDRAFKRLVGMSMGKDME